LGDRLWVVYTASETYFNHINNLASTTMMTGHAGTAVEDIVFYPWGQNTWKFWGSGGYPFANMPYYDTNTSTSPTMFRFYSMNLGRWHSPDPLGGDVTNPQSLNRYGYALNNPTSLTDPLGLDSEECSQSNEGCDPCNDPNYVGAECGGDGWPSGWPIWGGGRAGGGGGGSTPYPTPTANDGGLRDAEALMGNGCIEPSIFTSLFIWGGKWIARALSHGGNRQTQSVSWGGGASGGFGVWGVGPSGSISAVDTVDIYGHAAQVSTGQIGGGAQVGASVIAGILLGKSNAPVPTTPQSSAGAVTDPTITLSGVYGAGLNLDLAKSGATTLTAGYGLGARTRIELPSVLGAGYVWRYSIPYCNGGN
jgi:RHS repeat-associated protein